MCDESKIIILKNVQNPPSVIQVHRKWIHPRVTEPSTNNFHTERVPKTP